MRTITFEQSEQIAALDKARTDGGLGVIYDGEHYQCRDVRGDPAYAEYQHILGSSISVQSVSALQGMRAIAAAGLAQAFLTWKASLDPLRDFEAIAFLDKAQSWRADNPILNTALETLGVADQKDALFELAASL